VPWQSERSAQPAPVLEQDLAGGRYAPDRINQEMAIGPGNKRRGEKDASVENGRLARRAVDFRQRGRDLAHSRSFRGGLPRDDCGKRRHDLGEAASGV
jgi:hypothetical protein